MYMMHLWCNMFFLPSKWCVSEFKHFSGALQHWQQVHGGFGKSSRLKSNSLEKHFLQMGSCHRPQWKSWTSRPSPTWKQVSKMMIYLFHKLKCTFTEHLCTWQDVFSKVTIQESHHHCSTLLFSACGPRWEAQPLCISSHCSPPTRTESPLCVCSPQTPVPAAVRTPSWATGSPAITWFMQM